MPFLTNEKALQLMRAILVEEDEESYYTLLWWWLTEPQGEENLLQVCFTALADDIDAGITQNKPGALFLRAFEKFFTCDFREIEGMAPAERKSRREEWHQRVFGHIPSSQPTHDPLFYLEELFDITTKESDGLPRQNERLTPDERKSFALFPLVGFLAYRTEFIGFLPGEYPPHAKWLLPALKMVAQRGFVPAMIELALYYDENKSNRYRESFAWRKRAAQSGDRIAMIKLDEYRGKDKKVPIDVVEELYWDQLSCIGQEKAYIHYFNPEQLTALLARYPLTTIFMPETRTYYDETPQEHYQGLISVLKQCPFILSVVYSKPDEVPPELVAELEQHLAHNRAIAAERKQALDLIDASLSPHLQSSSVLSKEQMKENLEQIEALLPLSYGFKDKTDAVYEKALKWGIQHYPEEMWCHFKEKRTLLGKRTQASLCFAFAEHFHRNSQTTQSLTCAYAAYVYFTADAAWAKANSVDKWLLSCLQIIAGAPAKTPWLDDIELIENPAFYELLYQLANQLDDFGLEWEALKDVFFDRDVLLKPLWPLHRGILWPFYQAAIREQKAVIAQLRNENVQLTHGEGLRDKWQHFAANGRQQSARSNGTPRRIEQGEPSQSVNRTQTSSSPQSVDTAGFVVLST